MKLNKLHLVGLASFLTGFSALASQIVINRFLTTFLGSTTTVQLSTLTTFMTLLGLGAWFAPKKKSTLYCALGVLVFGSFTLGLIWSVFGILPPIDIEGPVSFWAFIIICTAPFALSYGTALAVFSKIMPSKDGPKGKFQKNYFIFHAGACLGLLFFDFILLPYIGMTNSLFLISLCCFTALIFLVGTRIEKAAVKDLKKGAYYKLFFYSVLFGVNQFVIFRSHYYIYGPTPQNFTMMMGISLLGLSLASTLAKSRGLKQTTYELYVPFFLIAYVLFHYLYIDSVAFLLDVFGNKNWAGYVAMTLMYLPFYIIQGALLPVFHGEEREESNKIIAVNSFGNVCGIVASTLVLINYFEPLFIVLTCVMIMGLAQMSKKPWRVFILIFVCLSMAWSLGTERYHYSFRYFSSPKNYTNTTSRLLRVERYASQGAEFSIHHLDQGKRYLVIDGYKTISLDKASLHMETEKLLGSYPSVLSEMNSSALVLGLGSKATVNEMARRFTSVESVEINPAIFKYRKYNLFKSPLVKDPVPENIKMIFGDGFSYLMFSDKTYDLILNNVPTPQYSAASNIWTQNLISIAKKKLNPGGVYGLWVNSNINIEALKVVTKTVMSVFPHCYLGVISPRYASLVCSQTKKNSFVNERGVLFYLDRDKIGWLKKTKVNTVDRPYLIYEMDYNLDSNWSTTKDWDILRVYGIMEEISADDCQKLKQTISYLGEEASLPRECQWPENEKTTL